MKKNSNEKTEKPKEIDDGLIAVSLIRTHVHAGETLQAGQVIRVNKAMKTWLIEHGIISRD